MNPKCERIKGSPGGTEITQPIPERLSSDEMGLRHNQKMRRENKLLGRYFSESAKSRQGTPLHSQG